MKNVCACSALVASLLFAAAPGAAAQTCSFSLSPLSFGAVDPSANTGSDSSATLSIRCTGAPFSTVRVCPGIGGREAGARQLLSGRSAVKFELYRDPARTLVWGAWNDPEGGMAPAIDLALDASGQASKNVPVYGRLFGRQQAPAPGAYQRAFSPAEVDIVYGAGTNLPCPGTGGMMQRTTLAWNASANVAAACTVTAQPINFGVHGTMGANIDATGRLNLTCTAGTAYSVGLSAGLNSTSAASRKMLRGTATIEYSLYQDPARLLVWGESVGVDTVSGNGTGSAQALTVYGRVPPQRTPRSGLYSDTVVVTVTY